MADNDNETKQKQLRNIDDLRNAMMEKDYRQVRRLCEKVPDGPLQRISIYEDTVLHMAAHSKQKDLVLHLLNMIPEDRNHQFSDIKNANGNTILHEIAISNALKDAVSELLRRAPNLLTACNNLGETPIFCAARHGQTHMFQFLAAEMKLAAAEQATPEDTIAHLRRNDGTTVLHVSIATECFCLAFFIVKSYPYLVEQSDHCSMTALQYLACNSMAFRRGEIQKRRGFMELLNDSKLINKSNTEVQQGDNKSKTEEQQGELAQLFSGICEVFFEKKESNHRNTLRKLVGLLVKKDTSWDANINSQAMSAGEINYELEIEECSSKLSQKKEGKNTEESSRSKNKKSSESPLFLATMFDIKEIVRAVLDYKPEALKHTNKEGMNILHAAILYRHIDIFDMVVKHEVFARRLLSGIDNEGNSVLHMVSKKRKSQASEKMQSPALQLRDELLLFEKVKSAFKMIVADDVKILNNDDKTAEELFAAANEQLHGEAKEWLMRTTENCTILSVFIATVAFAAIYTVPGGPNQNTGIPILHTKPFFLVFTIADVVSLALALTSVGVFLSILTSSFPLEDFKIYLFKKLIQGIICLVLSVSMMAVAFGATIALMMMSHNRENVVWSVVAFLPVPIFFLSYSPLRLAALGRYRELFKLFIVYFLVGLVVVILLPLLLARILSLFFDGLGWIVTKACVYIIYKPLCWICRVLARILSLFFYALRWTVRKACLFIIYNKPLSWICGSNSNATSDTESSQPNAAPTSRV